MQVDQLRTSKAQDPHAGIVSRAIAFVIDLLVMSVLVLLVVAFTQVVLNFFTLYGVLGRSALLSGSLRTIVTVCVTLIELAIVIGYPVGCWVLFGRTPGKALMGLCVVRVDGKRLTVWRALLRFAGYWLSAIPLGLGFWWVLGDSKRQAWHDKLAGTCVVYVWQPQYDQKLALR